MTHENGQIRSNDTEVLSEREVGVLQAAADGHSNKEIGAMLFLTPDTIDTHARRIIGKLGAKNMKQAVAIGLRRGIIQ